MRQIILKPGEDGWWIAEVLSLPGCITQGRTKEEAIDNARDAIEAWIAAATHEGIPVPPDRLDASLMVVGS